ncbi:hypothetical protein BGY98DRAFT_957156 [Russula aff. rugulosa BPL654]|nr:hypothetical protein BGY98DRAFT_957156 [Russula aff. rugulosa BPL654]
MCPRIGRFSLLLKMLSEHSTFPLAWRPCFLPLARAILLQAVETPRARTSAIQVTDISPINTTSSSASKRSTTSFILSPMSSLEGCGPH